MKTAIYFEWLHFKRNVARPIAVLLFLAAAIFGLYNGFSNYNERFNQIEAIRTQVAETQQSAYDWLEQGKSGPEVRPWVNIKEPFWSMWYATHYVINEPAPNMIFNVGQSDHFGYCKRVSMWTTAFDSDLTAELSNPEMVQLGALDFSFIWLYLMPLLLIVLTYHTKGLEMDLGFLPLLQVQQPNLNAWLIQRLAVIGTGVAGVLTVFMIASLIGVSSVSLGTEVILLWSIYILYLVLWLAVLYFIIRFGKGQADQALKMVGAWLLLTVVIPGSVNQYVLLQKPADLMMDMIEANRNGQSEIYDRPKIDIIKEVKLMMPELSSMEVSKADSLLTQDMIDGAYRLVLNDYMTKVSNRIMNDQKERNKVIEGTYWFNPVTGFHNWLNNITGTGHQAMFQALDLLGNEAEWVFYSLKIQNNGDTQSPEIELIDPQAGSLRISENEPVMVKLKVTDNVPLFGGRIDVTYNNPSGTAFTAEQYYFSEDDGSQAVYDFSFNLPASAIVGDYQFLFTIYDAVGNTIEAVVEVEVAK